MTLGIVLGQLFKDFYLDSERDCLKEDAELAALYLDGGELADIQDYVGQIDDESSFDILLLNRRMEVIAGTPFRVGSFDFRMDAASIPEGGTFGNETREDLIQFTKPIELSSGDTVYLSFIRYVSDLESVYDRIWLTIALALIFSFFLILFVLHNLTNQFIRPIDEATIVLRELADGNYRARVYELRNDEETGSLAGSINVLARNLETISLGESVQRARLESLIEYMGAGLLLVDERGIVTLVNRSYRDMFQYDELMIGQFYHGILPSPDVETLIEDVYLTEEPHRRQLSIRSGFNQKTYMVSAAPIFSDTGMLRGTTLLFNDITELKRLEKMRKDFVANVSHELKTPLTSIRGFSETLLDGAKEVPELRDQILGYHSKRSDAHADARRRFARAVAARTGRLPFGVHSGPAQSARRGSLSRAEPEGGREIDSLGGASRRGSCLTGGHEPHQTSHLESRRQCDQLLAGRQPGRDRRREETGRLLFDRQR